MTVGTTKTSCGLQKERKIVFAINDRCIIRDMNVMCKPHGRDRSKRLYCSHQLSRVQNRGQDRVLPANTGTHYL